MSYLLLKWLHLVGAALLLGTGLGIAFFAWFGVRMARRTGDLGLLRGVLRLTVIADFAFTAPAVVLQLASGLALWALAGQPWTHRWLLLVLGLYGGIGLLWLPVVVLQMRMRDLALAADGMAALAGRVRAHVPRLVLARCAGLCRRAGLAGPHGQARGRVVARRP